MNKRIKCRIQMSPEYREGNRIHKTGQVSRLAVVCICFKWFFHACSWSAARNAETASAHTKPTHTMNQNGKLLQFIFPQSYWAVEIVKYKASRGNVETNLFDIYCVNDLNVQSQTQSKGTLSPSLTLNSRLCVCNVQSADGKHE